MSQYPASQAQDEAPANEVMAGGHLGQKVAPWTSE